MKVYEQVTLEDYVQEYHPEILSQYQKYAVKEKKLTAEQICKLPIDTKNLSSRVASTFALQDITTIGKLLRILLKYDSILWINGIGVKTERDLHKQLSGYNVNVKEPHESGYALRKYALRYCKRKLTVNVANIFEQSTAEILEANKLYTVDDIIRYLNRGRYLHHLHGITKRKTRDIELILGTFAPSFELLLKEFK